MTREEMIERLKAFCDNVRGCAVCPVDSTLCDVSSFAEMSDEQLAKCMEAITDWQEKALKDAQKAADELHESIGAYWRKDAIERLNKVCDDAEGCHVCPLDDAFDNCGFSDMSDEQLAKCLELAGEAVIPEVEPLQAKHGALIEDVCARIAKSEAADPVHPKHYELPGGLQVIDVEIATQGVEAVKDHCICTALEYLLRRKGKNGDEDVRKAAWWLAKYIDLIEKKEATT